MNGREGCFRHIQKRLPLVLSGMEARSKESHIMHTNRFPMILLIYFCLTFLFILATSDAFSTSRSFTLTILHTNDTYGRLQPFSIADTKFGGVLSRAYMIRQVRQENPNAVIVLDAGDAIGPYPLAAFDSGKTVIGLMNKMGYTAMTL